MIGFRKVVLEYLALWEGRLTAERLGALTGIRREQAQNAIITPYRTDHPGRLTRTHRGFRIDPDHALALSMPSDPGGFVAALTGLKTVMPGDGWPLAGNFESVPLVCRASADNTMFLAIYQAMCSETAVHVHYRSKRATRAFVFSPHTLVETGDRPHFRGFAANPLTGDGSFRDLVPLRAVEVAAYEARYVPATGDADWHARTDLTFRLRPEVSDDVGAALDREYVLDRDRALTIPGVRHALVRYVERHFLAVRVEGSEEAVFHRVHR